MIAAFGTWPPHSMPVSPSIALNLLRMSHVSEFQTASSNIGIARCMPNTP